MSTLAINIYERPGAVVIQLKGEAGLAIQDFDSAIKLNPRDATALYYRSVAKRNTGDTDSIAKDLAAAKAIDPDIANKAAQ
jgi:tetratricopeptide (TPR) repeat protein